MWKTIVSYFPDWLVLMQAFLSFLSRLPYQKYFCGFARQGMSEWHEMVESKNAKNDTVVQQAGKT